MWFIVYCDAIYLQCFGDLDLSLEIEEGVRKLVTDVSIVENKNQPGRVDLGTEDSYLLSFSQSAL